MVYDAVLAAGSRISRRGVLLAGAGAGVGLAAAASASGPDAHAARPRIIVENGLSPCVVVTADDASAGVLQGAAELVDCIARSTGVVLPRTSVPSAPPAPELKPIYVGTVQARSGQSVAAALEGLAPDGFVVAPHGTAVTIVGGTEWGTLNGVRWFLETYVGVRWLMPGDIGEDLPARTTIVGPSELVRQEPAFLGRRWAGMGDPPGTGPYPTHATWAQRNRLQGGYNWPVEFHHNLHTLLPPAVFQGHPEYYANGIVPAPGSTTGWQPNFREPATVTIAVNRINAHFAANPQAASYSLAVNDGAGFDLSEPSEAYYAWVNQVVAGVVAVHPDKKFGLLAYREVEPPPSFSLHPAVVVFFTQDRYAWADPAVEASSKARLEEWRTRCTDLGWYDYIYGTPYVVPRLYEEVAARALRYGRDVGVKYVYSEMYQNWAEGPKPWIRARLHWDPDLDVATLKDEWCLRAVGPVAAPHLREYYDLWDDFWTTRVIRSSWFQPRATYQDFQSAGYLAVARDADVARSRDLLELAVAGAVTPQQRARAEALLKGFAYYEASVLSYPKDVPAPSTSAEAIEQLAEVERSWQTRRAWASQRPQIWLRLSQDPLLKHPLNGIAMGLVWYGWSAKVLWGVVDHLRRNEPDGGAVTDWLVARRAPTAPTLFTSFVKLAHDIGTGTPPANPNAGFEEGIDPWFLWVTDIGSFSIGDAAHTGGHGLTGHRMRQGGPAVRIPVSVGLQTSRSWLRFPGEVSWHGNVRIATNLQNAAGATLTSINSSVTEADTVKGEWHHIDTLTEVPSTSAGQPVVQIQHVVRVDQLQNDPDFHIDDSETWFAAPDPEETLP